MVHARDAECRQTTRCHVRTRREHDSRAHTAQHNIMLSHDTRRYVEAPKTFDSQSKLASSRFIRTEFVFGMRTDPKLADFQR